MQQRRQYLDTIHKNNKWSKFFWIDVLELFFQNYTSVPWPPTAKIKIKIFFLVFN